ncbi:MAG: hypothetical protein EBY16_04865 [Gammaproteobacteria bacterium]|nr:hypothetical protein [Gammaproteobacteria bacterium]
MIQLFHQIIDVYWRVLCFKKSPFETPHSAFMLGMGVLLSICVSMAQLFISNQLAGLSLSLALSIGMILAQLGLFLLYSRLVLWSQNALDQWIRLCTCWVMMLFFLDGIALLVMLLVYLLNVLGLLSHIKQVMVVLTLASGIALSFWQIVFTMRLLMSILKKSSLVALGIYLGWFGINFLFLLSIKNIFQV